MKKKIVLPTINREVMTTEEMPLIGEFYYGIQGIVSGDRGFITRTRYHTGSYQVLRALALTEGNCWNIGDLSNMDLRPLIERLLNNDLTVYQFDTFKELTDWINSPPTH